MSEGGTEETRGRLRHLNLTMMLPPIVAAGVFTVAFDAQSWLDVVVLGLGVVAVVVTFVRWTMGALFPVAIPCLVVAAVVWPYGVLGPGAGTAFFSIASVGSLVVSRLPGRRGAAAVGLVAYVAAVGVARLLVAHEDALAELFRFALLPAGITAVITGLMFPNKRFYDVVRDLEESRDREAELAVARERIRFASDLHDIQGHTLHVVKLKVALAQRLVRTDAGRAEEELREIHALVADTITQTKELAYAHRRLNLSAELENAKNLFEAAGIRVRVHREADVDTVDTGAGELLGQVLRETTTNILRHAQAGQVRITLSKSGITIVNDGAPEGPVPALSGLATLRQRLAGNGGELTVEQHDGSFLTAAAFPHDRPEDR
ncbi:sensor histidine kinase [Amycolatopsis sp. 195334CR]|uniref:sensor histidine kinase n=1 Tax=Amycolatopsis sp. 195334CR TaxID=2814588 RepID=UPI001A8F8007|nr:histidine kinase [Amycolatopsis sp. 195334CR]MBN6042253.1 sensor histidine kinase [Amycolatopsis sp. 195334CR]